MIYLSMFSRKKGYVLGPSQEQRLDECVDLRPTHAKAKGPPERPLTQSSQHKQMGAHALVSISTSLEAVGHQ